MKEMTEDYLRALEEAIRKERKHFWLAILTAYLTLLLLENLGHVSPGNWLGYLRQTFPSNLLDLSRELRGALVVSFVIFAIEGRVRRRHLEQIQSNVLASVLKVAMPEELANELLEIIKERVFRERLRYTITFREVTTEPSDYFILERELSYTVRNITATTQFYPIRSTTDWRYSFIANPEVFGINVDNHPVRLVDGRRGALRRAVEGLLKRAIRQSPSGVIDVKAESIEMRYKIHVPGRGTRQVTVKAYEIVRLDERNYTIVFSAPGADLEVVLVNQCRGITYPKAELNHRPDAEFTPGHGMSYGFPGAVLPGQSFEVSWTPARPEANNNT